MTPPPTIMSAVLDSPWIRRPWRRRAVFGVGALVLALLCVWPRPYLAMAQMLPNDPSAAGGAGLLGVLFGGRQSIEVDLTVGRSQAVLNDVVERLRRDGRLRGGDVSRALVRLRRKVGIEAVRGGILQISVRDHDPAFATTVVENYVLAIRDRLAALTLQQTAERKRVAVNRMGQATVLLARTQAALDRFRAANKLAAPETQLGAAVSLLTNLQASLQAEQTGLQDLLHFATGENIQVQAARARIAVLQGQIARAEASQNNGATEPGAVGLTPQLTEYENLYRDEKYAEVEFEIYRRYLDTIAVDELSAPINMDVIEPPYLDPVRHYNASFVGALVFLLIFAVIAEIYLVRPRTGGQ